jgi:phosphopentomutase
VPILSLRLGVTQRAIGRRQSFADVVATLLHEMEVADYTKGNLGCRIDPE